MNNNITYLDYAASVPIKYWAQEYSVDHNFNPNQPYATYEAQLLKDAEQIVLASLGSKTGHVVFGANATVMADYVLNMTDWMTEVCVVNPYEHDCFAKTLRYKNMNPLMFVIDDYNTLNDQLKYHAEQIKESAECAYPVCFWMWVNNLMGQTNPVDTIGKTAHSYDMEFICDLTAGLYNEVIPPNIDKWCDIAIWSGSKIGTKNCTGGIWFSDKAWKRYSSGNEPPVYFGTSNVAQAIAQAKAIEDCQKKLKETIPETKKKNIRSNDHVMFRKWHNLYNYLLEKLGDISLDYDNAKRLCGYEFDDAVESIVPLYLPDIDADAFQQFASTHNVYFSTFHSVCVDENDDYRVAKAYGLTEEQAKHCIRLSFGYETTNQDIDKFIDVLKKFRETLTNDKID